MDPFATATEACEFTGMTIPVDLARLQALLDAASAEIRIFCDRVLSQVDNETITFGPTWRDTLILPEPPVRGIDSVVEDSVTLVLDTDYTFTNSGLVYRWASAPTSVTATTKAWDDGATIIYDHGYLETDSEFTKIKTVCIQAAMRAFTLNERSASEAMGSTLMESAGYAPEVFLTEGEKVRLMDLDRVGVG